MQHGYKFASVQAYLNARGSGGSIYNVLNSVAAGTPSAYTMSLITPLGKNITDSVNTIVPQNQGAVGDLLVYSSTYGFQWVKGNNYQWQGVTCGNTIVQSALTSNGYTPIGWCVYRNGFDCLICSLENLGGKTWGPATTESVDTSTVVNSPKRSNGIMGGSLKRAEEVHPSGNQYVLPITRSTWDAAVKAGTASLTGLDGATYNLSDWRWNFDYWYRMNYLVQFPTLSGAMKLANGRQNTKVLIDKYGLGSSYAFQVAYGHGVDVNADGNNFTAGTANNIGNWWLPSCQECWHLLEHYYELNAAGAAISNDYYWSSTQAGASYAWYVLMSTAFVGHLSKSNVFLVRAFSAFTIKQ